MRSNSRLSVAIHALLLLDRLDQDSADPVTSEYIASSVNTNPVVIRRVLASLMKAGLVMGTKGARGGYRLSRPAARITAWDVYQAVREEQPLGAHAQAPNPRCPVGRHIERHLVDLYGAAEAAMKTVLEATTLRGMRQKIAREG